VNRLLDDGEYGDDNDDDDDDDDDTDNARFDEK